jgi:urease accessory protein
MRRLVQHARAGDWPEASADGSLTLALAERNRRRIRLTTDAGEPVLLDLPTPVMLAEGDGLAGEAAGWLAVHAAAEDVLDIAAQDASHLARLAWHLGNRHLPVEVLPDGGLRIAYDHVIEHMLAGLGALTLRRAAPFQPEPGAYAGGHHHHE